MAPKKLAKKKPAPKKSAKRPARSKGPKAPRKRFEQQPLPLAPEGRASELDAAPAEAPAEAPAAPRGVGRPRSQVKRSKFSVILEDDTIAQLRAVADEQGHAEIAPVVRVAIRRYLQGLRGTK